MIKRQCVIVGLFLAVFSMSASAQTTHPCDAVIAQPQTVQGGANNGFGLCTQQQDMEGNSTFITSHRFVVDGVEVFNGQLTQVGGVSATGWAYFVSPRTLTFSRGDHSAVAYSSNIDGESAPSAPHAFTVKGPVPKPPAIKGVIK